LLEKARHRPKLLPNSLVNFFWIRVTPESPVNDFNPTKIMKRRNWPQSRRWFTGAAATVTAFSGGQSIQALPSTPPVGSSERFPVSLGQFAFQREGILGTSFELYVGAVRANDARVCEQQVLAEIERLRLIFSTYDSASEISRVRAGAPVASTELNALLSAYELWTQRTDGALHLNMAEVIRLWKEASDLPPAVPALANAFAQPRAYNVDALGKGYIIDRAVEVARRFAPAGLLNIGGDIRVWGGVAWPIGIANPFAPAENAPLLGQFTLREGAVATSGGYSRFINLAGQRYSHILDPRTLQPVNQVSSATIVAPDCLTANALSTAANVLGLGEGVRLAKLFGAWEYLLVDAAGRIEKTTAMAAGVADAPAPPALDKPVTETPSAPVAPAAGPAWPTNFQMAINLHFKAPAGGRAKRPYIAVWVEDSNKKLVRTVTIWGSDWKWLKELSGWWKAADSYTDAFTQSVTRATRAPGNYVLAWDGLDDKKQPVPQGEYKIFMEINREHGRHLTESVTIQCGAEAQSVELRATPESDASQIEYGPKAP
jgi:thiamine biosynthesis lipoprotein ApbE